MFVCFYLSIFFFFNLHKHIRNLQVKVVKIVSRMYTHGIWGKTNKSKSHDRAEKNTKYENIKWLSWEMHCYTQETQYKLPSTIYEIQKKFFFDFIFLE